MADKVLGTKINNAKEVYQRCVNRCERRENKPWHLHTVYMQFYCWNEAIIIEIVRKESAKITWVDGYAKTFSVNNIMRNINIGVMIQP